MPYINRRAAAVAVLILCLGMTVLLFIKGVYGPFQFDDERDIVERAEVRDGPWPAMRSSPYRAITYLTYSFDWGIPGTPYLIRRELSKVSPEFPFHRTNLLIHLAVVALLFALSFSFCPDDRAVSRIGCAAIGALFFGLHPLMVSNVTYISGRAGLLAGLFSLAVIWFYWRRPFRGWLAPALACFILALFSKEDAASLPLLLLALGLVKAGRAGSDRESKWSPLLLAAPFFILAAVYGLFRIFAHTMLLGEKEGLSLSEHLLLGPYVWMRLLFMMFWPVGLSVDHHVLPIAGFLDPRLWFPVFGIIGLVIFEVWLWKRNRVGVLWLIWFAAALLPATVMPLADPLAQNRAYFALAGIGMGIGFMAGWWTKELRIKNYELRRKKFSIHNSAFIILTAAVLILMAFLTFHQQEIWAGQLTLWADAVRKAPEAARPWVDLTVVRVRRREIGSAFFAVKRSMALDNQDAVLWNALGLIYKEKGDLNEALRSYGKAIELDPSLKKVRTNRAHVLLALERTEEAERAYHDALTLDPLDSDAHYGLGFLYLINRRFDEAREEMQKTLSLNPNDIDAREILKKLPPPGSEVH